MATMTLMNTLPLCLILTQEDSKQILVSRSEFDTTSQPGSVIMRGVREDGTPGVVTRTGLMIQKILWLYCRRRSLL